MCSKRWDIEYSSTESSYWVPKYKEVNCSVCLVVEVKDGLNNGADGRVQGRGAQMTVPTSPSSVIKAAQSYPSGFASQQGMK